MNDEIMMLRKKLDDMRRRLEILELGRDIERLNNEIDAYKADKLTPTPLHRQFYYESSPTVAPQPQWAPWDVVPLWHQDSWRRINCAIGTTTGSSINSTCVLTPDYPSVVLRHRSGSATMTISTRKRFAQPTHEKTY